MFNINTLANARPVIDSGNGSPAYPWYAQASSYWSRLHT